MLTCNTPTFSCAKHKPCFYYGTIDKIHIFLLQQVNDFKVAVPSEVVANSLFTKIQSGLKQPLKLISHLIMFNGINIVQSKCFVNLSCKIYITKILEGQNGQ